MMIYISKGIVERNSTENILNVQRGGKSFQLTGLQAKLWLDGRYDFNEACMPDQLRDLDILSRMGLVETEEENTALGRYRIMTRCVCCPADTRHLDWTSGFHSSYLLGWLRHAGIRLSVAELILLSERGIRPEKEYLGIENRQNLIEVIYTRDNIAENLLETQMESAMSRDNVVQSLIGLLKKKKILIL